MDSTGLLKEEGTKDLLTQTHTKTSDEPSILKQIARFVHTLLYFSVLNRLHVMGVYAIVLVLGGHAVNNNWINFYSLCEAVMMVGSFIFREKKEVFFRNYSKLPDNLFDVYNIWYLITIFAPFILCSVNYSKIVHGTFVPSGPWETFVVVGFWYMVGQIFLLTVLGGFYRFAKHLIVVPLLQQVEAQYGML